MKKFFLILSIILSNSAMAADADAVGSFKVGSKKMGLVSINSLTRAIHDTKVTGVTCHVTTMEKTGLTLAADPGNSSVACRQTGSIKISRSIAMGTEGETMSFSGASKAWLGTFFKEQRMRRIYDEANNTLIYITYTTKMFDGSYKQSVSTISLYGLDVEWVK